MKHKARKVTISRQTLTVLQRYASEIAGEEKRSVDEAIMVLIGNSELARIERMAARLVIQHSALSEAQCLAVAQARGTLADDLEKGAGELDSQEVCRAAIKMTAKRMRVFINEADEKRAHEPDRIKRRELETLAGVLRGESDLFGRFAGDDKDGMWNKVTATSGTWMN
ncbi:MAG: hypothetical protein F4213_13180 [Boseongicola sp. SB0677_bin_26]|nr:hypothetical protein [Boseongicola sp. SB0665_bin_10]MYG26953.1 hypothetical protein [Boseongicola sp. SB0677_bin_26]